MKALEAIEEADVVDVRHRFVKMILGVTVGFIAAELVKNAYTKYVIDRNSDIIEVTESE